MSSSDAPPDLRFQSYSATFSTHYTDRSKSLTGELNIRLENDGFSGYTIDGDGNDADGITQFTDGFVTYSGNAWWLEETLSGQDKGLKILSRGKFDFVNHTFTGTWRSSTECSGVYTSCIGRDVMRTLNTNGTLEQTIPSAQATLEENIPIAFATEDAPVIMATPESLTSDRGKNYRIIRSWFQFLL